MFAFTPALSPQVVLINAVRDVAKALAELIGATKCAAGKPADDPSMYQLKSAAKVQTAQWRSARRDIPQSFFWLSPCLFQYVIEGKSDVTGPISICIALCFCVLCAIRFPSTISHPWQWETLRENSGISPVSRTWPSKPDQYKLHPNNSVCQITYLQASTQNKI